MTSTTPIPSLKLQDVLLIEDDADHLELTVQALHEAGVRNPLHTAGSLAEALAYLKERARLAETGDGTLPCLILLDLRLPDGSGLDLLQEIRQTPALRLVPVVILTTSENPPDINRAYTLGANSYLVKPVHFDEFHNKVREAGLYWVLLNQSCQP